MENKDRSHRAHLVHDYREDEDICRMDWPTKAPDLNPKDYVLDTFRREKVIIIPLRELFRSKKLICCRNGIDCHRNFSNASNTAYSNAERPFWMRDGTIPILNSFSVRYHSMDFGYPCNMSFTENSAYMK
ncbi:hypothetical protein TNCV_3114141 [Trichonephila clavipes]|nr:hypothetical protein TNCV_3114141 [Trichonephila clavipes]